MDSKTGCTWRLDSEEGSSWAASSQALGIETAISEGRDQTGNGVGGSQKGSSWAVRN